MKKKIILLLIMALFLIPLKTNALSKTYTDKMKDIVQTEETDKVKLYLFHGAECPHCEEERNWLKKIEEKYKDELQVNYYEVWHDKENAETLKKVIKKYKIKEAGVPLTIIGDKYYVGYSKTIGSAIENKIKEYTAPSKTKNNKVKIPILGTVNVKNVSIPLVAVILGFIDGFNPCAMWILLFLINLLFGMKNKKKAWVLGITFLLVSGLIYLLSMIGINFVIGVATINWLKIIIALLILVAGILNLRKYIKTRNEEVGCTVINPKKRKKMTTRMKKIINNNSFLFALIGIAVLSVSVNLIELACSLGFPVIFTEILSINNITGLEKIIYLIIYIIFYMLDDIVVFSISMITLQATGITNKYSKLCTLISSIIMITMGLLLLLKPEWLMLNF